MNSINMNDVKKSLKTVSSSYMLYDDSFMSAVLFEVRSFFYNLVNQSNSYTAWNPWTRSLSQSNLSNGHQM